MASKFAFLNSSQRVPAGVDGKLPSEFSITAPPATDIWAKPPSTFRFNAPILYQPIRPASFKRAQISLNANWKDLYDQGGLILVLDSVDEGRKWIKTGIELAHGKPHVSTVTKDRWADWSLLPIPSGGAAVTIEMVKGEGNKLWIYLVEATQKLPIREVTWAFEGIQDCWVGVYAAKPSKGEELVVNFEQAVIEVED